MTDVLTRLVGALADRYEVQIRTSCHSSTRARPTACRGYELGHDDRLLVKLLPSTAPQSDIRVMTGRR